MDAWVRPLRKRRIMHLEVRDGIRRRGTEGQGERRRRVGVERTWSSMRPRRNWPFSSSGALSMGPGRGRSPGTPVSSKSAKYDHSRHHFIAKRYHLSPRWSAPLRVMASDICSRSCVAESAAMASDGRTHTTKAIADEIRQSHDDDQ